MLKRSIRWIIPLVVLAVLAIALVVTTSTGTFASTVKGKQIGSGGATPTATSGGITPNGFNMP